MRESVKDKRDHKYGRVHRKNRELRLKIIHESASFWQEYCKFLEDTRNDSSKETLYERDEMYKAYRYDVAKDLKDELDKLWEEAGLNNKEERCRFWRAIGHSAHGKANIKHDRARRIVSNKKRIQIKKQKAFDKADRRIKDDEE
jgi:hypothetical protein